MSTAQFVPCHDDGSPCFTGWLPRECGEHRTVGDHRAWCFDCSEWCYSHEIGAACKGCEVSAMRGDLTEVESLRAEVESLRAVRAVEGVET